MSVKVNALDHLVINVADVARSAEWYRKILGMEVRVFDPGAGKTPRTSLMFGNQKINVRPRDDVCGAARRVSNDPLDRPGRIIQRQGAADRSGHRKADCGQADRGAA